MPISSRLPDFRNREEPEKFKAAQTEWGRTFDGIQEAIRKAVAHVPAADKRIKSTRNFYSVTDDETRRGQYPLPCAWLGFPLYHPVWQWLDAYVGPVTLALQLYSSRP